MMTLYLHPFVLAVGTFPLAFALPDTIPSFINPTATFASYVQLAAIMVPRRKTGLKQMLRPACPYIPMPLSLGWHSNPLESDYSPEDLVPDLSLTDIGSGATRRVVAPWMHALYKHTWDAQPSGVSLMHLKEAQFTIVPGWQHVAIWGVLLVQFSLGLYAFGRRQQKQGAILLIGLVLHILEGVYTWAFPRDFPPRRVEQGRLYALHTGMTTRHLLVLSHDPGTGDGKYRGVSECRHINLEDAAVPLRRVSKGGLARIEAPCAVALRWGSWMHTIACLFPSNVYILPMTFLIGTIAIEILSTFTTALPKYSACTPLETAKTKERSSTLLDMVLAACQATGCVSTGFVEAILPDPTGAHVDYTWISNAVMKGVTTVGPHPNHQITDAVYASARQRRTVQVSMAYIAFFFSKNAKPLKQTATR